MALQLRSAALSLLIICTAGINAQTYVKTNFDKMAAIKEAKENYGSCGCMMGPQGNPGVPGVPGMHGITGKDGYKGEKGVQGDIGKHGPPGNPGLMGPIGPTGHRGKKGMDGITGETGADGSRGQKGERGYSGLPGQKGGKGDAANGPKKVAFSVGRSQKLGPVLQDTPITYDNVFSNIGGGFDEYSSHFVCKVNGTYLFLVHVLAQNNKNAYAWIMQNSKHKVPLHADERAGYGTGSQSIILSLRTDDHIWVQLNKDSALLNDYSTFSGYLLFEEDPEIESNYIPESTNSRYWFRK